MGNTIRGWEFSDFEDGMSSESFCARGLRDDVTPLARKHHFAGTCILEGLLALTILIGV